MPQAAALQPLLLVQRSINHARPGSSKVANRIILGKTDSCRDAPETQIVSGCLPGRSREPRPCTSAGRPARFGLALNVGG
jgi:hypothetical protein